MPLTPFHFGPPFLIGILLPRRINMAAILLASVAVDVEPIYCLFNNCQLHGLLHTYIGATAFSLTVVTIIIYLARKQFQKISDMLKVKQDYSLKTIIIGALVGGWSHVFLDLFMHFDVTPFWPVPGNPFLGVIDNSTNYLITIIGFTFGGILFFWRVYKLRTVKSTV